jgi:ABC-2 type transport system permease protein
MSVAKLASIELLKTRKRFAFWMALLFFFGFFIIALGGGLYEHIRTGAAGTPLPRSWQGIINLASSLGMLVILVTVVLLTASEKTWRTQRQNVIDGLSRTQFFTAKVITMAAVVGLLWIGVLSLTAGFGIVERIGETAELPLVRSIDGQLMGGLLLSLVLAGAMALFFGIVGSSSGAGLALAFLFLFSQTPIAMLLVREGGIWEAMAAFLPLQVLQALTSSTTWDAESLANTLERLRQMEEAGSSFSVPRPLGAAETLSAAVAYIAAFLGGAWLVIRRRDL